MLKSERLSLADAAKPKRTADPTDRPALKTGGGERDRTDDPLLAKQVLSQLSYAPESLSDQARRRQRRQTVKKDMRGWRRWLITDQTQV